MIRFVFLIAAILSVPAARVWAAEEAQHPMDRFLDECAPADASAAELLACQAQAYRKWEAEIAAAVQALRAGLDEAGQRALDLSQSRWEAFRGAHYELLGRVYAQANDPEDAPWQGKNRLEIVRQRAFELEDLAKIAAHRSDAEDWAPDSGLADGDCLAEAAGDQGRADCYLQAARDWSRESKDAVLDLASSLDQDGAAAALKADQERWAAFDSAQAGLVAVVCAGLPADKQAFFNALEQAARLREWALDLEDLEDLFDQEGEPQGGAQDS